MEAVDDVVAQVVVVVNLRLLRLTCREEPTRKRPPVDEVDENQGAAGGQDEDANLSTWSAYCPNKVYFR